jgi:hypothetical protein
MYIHNKITWTVFMLINNILLHLLGHVLDINACRIICCKHFLSFHEFPLKNLIAVNQTRSICMKFGQDRLFSKEVG